MEKNLRIYKASAGSGKTYTLVKEFLKLCLSTGSFSFKQILAVTFTNKAANEMKAKLLSNLDGIIKGITSYNNMKNDILDALKIDEKVLMERAKSLYSNILHNYSDLNVSTIDSFVQQLSRSFTRELNLPNQYRVLVDDEDMLDDLIQLVDDKIGKNDTFITHILSSFIRYKLNEENTWWIDSPIKSFIKKLLKENAYRKGENLGLQKSTLTKEQYEEVKKSLDNNVNYLKESIDKNLGLIKRFNEKNHISEETYNSVLPTFIKKIENDRNVTPSDLSGKTVKKIIAGDAKWYKGKNVPSNVDGEDVVSYFNNIINSHKSLYLVNIIRKNLHLYVMRGTLIDIVNEYIEDTNRVYISEFNKRISDIIGDCDTPFIYERLGSRYKHFFIDEFQDTSLLQWFNFLPLIHNSLADSNMNLLVGDAKQAIYRFRSGEVEQIIQLPEIYKKPNNGVFDDYEKKFRQEILVNDLDVNYRSSRNIIEFNNSFFDKTHHILAKKEYRSVYSENMRQKFSGIIEYPGCVSVEIFKVKDEKDTKKSDYKDSVKRSLLRDINILKDKGFKNKDITILVRSGEDGIDIAEYLTKNNVNVISSDSILLKSSDKVQLIISTLRYLTSEKDDVVKLIRSYYHDLCQSDDKYADEPNDMQYALNADIDNERLYELRNKTYSIYDLCAALVKMYGFNIVDDVFVQYFMGVVYDWQNNENNGIKPFLEFWDKKSKSFYVKISGEIDAVQIMTIHKSKGLEFKVVMYPYVNTRVPELFHPNEKWLPIDKNLDFLKEDVPYLKDFILPIGKSLVDTSLESHYLEELEKASFDDYNVMYVAMTRPKYILFMYSSDYASNENPYNIFDDYFEHTDLEFETECKDKSVVYRYGSIDVFSEEKKKSDNTILELGGEIPTTIDWTEKIKINPDPTMFWAKDDELSPQEWGDMVHEILSKINTYEDADEILASYVGDGCIDEKQARELKSRFEKIVGIQEVTMAYSKEAKVRNESDILTTDGNIIRPDRFVELPDRYILIDYKTGKPNKKYNYKLQDYMLALHNMGIEKRIDAYLIYLGESVYAEQVFLDRLF